MIAPSFFRDTELDATSYPAWRDSILEAEAAGAAVPGEPRSYPGYPSIPLERLRQRLWPPLAGALARRRCRCPLGTAQPTRRALSRLLQTAHGITGPGGRGPVPSAGGLQALELFIAPLGTGWLAPGTYHYDRNEHLLSRITMQSTPVEWRSSVPSLDLVGGGSLLWVLVGDGARVRAKYQERGLRFLLLEAGHLMQNLCLASVSLGLFTVPLGGFFEAEIARRLLLPREDEVLYLGVCGPVSESAARGGDVSQP
jgi:SagB-type dehydrogenase family enzyme